MSNTLQQIATQSKDASTIFEKVWGEYGFKGVNSAERSNTTPPVQRVIDVEDMDKTRKKLEQLKSEKDVGEGMVRSQVGEIQQKQMTGTEVEEYVPLVFDPEIVSILKQNAPIVEAIPEEGQEGYKAVYNIVGGRDQPLGFGTEADVLDMSGDTPSDITFEKDEVDMTIWRDLVQISDFTQAAAEHYMNVEDTTLGERVAEHAQVKAAQILYGDPSQNTGTGFIGDSEGYKGLSAYADDQGNVIDKSGVTEDFVEDIKQEVHNMIQEENVNPNNLMIACSWDMYDKLENEADFNKLRTDPSDRTVNVGLNQLQIAGVPVQPSHNVQSYTDGAYEPGDNGDVFIFSTRTARYRALMPMSMVPLAKTGLSETMALAEFGAFIEKSQGHFVRHLEAYDL